MKSKTLFFCLLLPILFGACQSHENKNNAAFAYRQIDEASQETSDSSKSDLSIKEQIKQKVNNEPSMVLTQPKDILAYLYSHRFASENGQILTFASNGDAYLNDTNFATQFSVLETGGKLLALV